MPSVFYSADKSEFELGKFAFITIKIKAKSNARKTVLASEIGGNANSANPDSPNADITLFNIPIKPVTVNVVDRKYVSPCGTLFGTKIFTDGVIIVNTASVETEDGELNPSETSKLRKGDVIKKAGGKNVNSNEELAEIIEKSEGKSLEMTVVRGNLIFDTFLKPVKSVGENTFRAGIWVRDSSSGIGTMTFYDPEDKMFAGLGHGIRDDQAKELLPLLRGDIMKTEIRGVIKSFAGSAGEIRGSFKGEPIGKLKSNTEYGIFGKLYAPPGIYKPIPVAMKQEIEIGPAKIISMVKNSGPAEYDINITNINFNRHDLTKNIVFSVTDKSLLEITGGIVRGMSGSPVIQNGFLAGAVTHVAIKNPKTGYAIFAETMYNRTFL
jgi:stage IV sporulation protein B